MAVYKKQSLTHPATLDGMSKKISSQHPDVEKYHNSVGHTFPGSLMERMGMEVLEHTANRTVVRMPVEGNTQRVPILHGGASAALAETAGSLAASATITDDMHIAVGTDLNISHLRPVHSGYITATAQAEHLGRSSTVHSIQIRNDDNRLIAVARITNRIIERRF